MIALLLALGLAANPACRYGVPPGACTADLATCCPPAVDWRAVDDALREEAAAVSCDLATLRAELRRVRVEIALATRPEDRIRLQAEFDRILEAIERCGMPT